MIDREAQSLIDAALDGTLSGSQQARVQQLLESSEEAREYQSGLTQVDQLLRSANQLPEPDGLHERIVDAISLPEARTSQPAAGWLPSFMRYGFAAAAGLLVAVGIYEFVPQIATETQYESMAGTMVPKRNGVAIRELDSLAVSAAGLESRAGLELRGDSLVLEVALDAGQPVTLRVALDGDGLAFAALAQSQSNFESFEYTDRVIEASGSGAQQFTVLVNRTGPLNARTTASIRLEYSSNEGLVYSGTLNPGESIFEQ